MLRGEPGQSLQGGWFEIHSLASMERSQVWIKNALEQRVWGRATIDRSDLKCLCTGRSHSWNEVVYARALMRPSGRFFVGFGGLLVGLLLALALLGSPAQDTRALTPRVRWRSGSRGSRGASGGSSSYGTASVRSRPSPSAPAEAPVLAAVAEAGPRCLSGDGLGRVLSPVARFGQARCHGVSQSAAHEGAGAIREDREAPGSLRHRHQSGTPRRKPVD